MSSVTLLRRLGNHSRENRLYRAFGELGQAIRTITLLRYLSEPVLREQVTQVTNRNEAFHGLAGWLMSGGRLTGRNDPGYQEKVIKFSELLASCVMYSRPWTSPAPPATSPARGTASILTTWPPSPRTLPAPSAGPGSSTSVLRLASPGTGA